MEFVTIKPLSVNEAWKGKRYKTDKYMTYEHNLLYLLPKITLPNPPYSIILEFGMSNILSDFDNPCKPFIDVLQKKYGFNDKLIMSAQINKVKVDKGREYIGFSIKSL